MKLVIFDVDGTLVDSQAHIYGAMTRAFEAQGLIVPGRQDVLDIVGLSVAEAMAVLASGSPEKVLDALQQDFKAAYAAMRSEPGTRSPLYAGARDAILALAAREDVALAVATGNSRRGLTHVIETHGFDGLFQSLQTADDHPSKPHPSMIETCLADTGAVPEAAVMIGDTGYDIGMAVAAKVTGLGVSWGYHRAEALKAAGAAAVLSDFADLLPWLDQHWSAS